MKKTYSFNSHTMTAFQGWLGIAFVLFILELFIPSGFALLCFAVGALAATLAALAGVNIYVQLVAFTVITLLSFIFIQPFLISHLNKRSKERPKTNADALIGKTARVIETIHGKAKTGIVAIDGDRWQAFSENGDEIKEGEMVEVTAINSIILTVRKL